MRESSVVKAMLLTMNIQLLRHSPFRLFLDVDPSGNQLTSFIAVVNGIKPAMDLWIKPKGWNRFLKMIEYFRLHYYLDVYFDNHAPILETLPKDMITTTRAALSNTYGDQTEAHVFVSTRKDNLVEAVNRGWYPLFSDGYLIEKHAADYDAFGKALGYPDCCLSFFAEYNNWFCYNTYYTSYHKTVSFPRALSNGLLRHTAYSLIPHMPCSFDCVNTMSYASRLKAAIQSEDTLYGEEIQRRLVSPTLCISELKIYRFSGEIMERNIVVYQYCEPITPTQPNDPLYTLLAQGDRCELQDNIIRVYKNNMAIGVYIARGDRHGPEAPFIVKCK